MKLDPKPAASEEFTLDCGVFTLSLDFELIWGTVDLFGPDRYRRACLVEREVVIDRLLDLLTRFDISATWCIVGHLFLDACAPDNGHVHPEIIRPRHAWVTGDWFAHDPTASEEVAPEFYGRSLVRKILSCPIRQEIGSHSFSHVIFGDAGCSAATAHSELAACVRLAADMGIALRSFAFPRNLVGHLDALGAHGFACFRGPEPHWYERRALPGFVKRLLHLWDVVTIAAPPVVLPDLARPGVWNVPGSMFYFPMRGSRRHIPLSFRVGRAIKGLNQAAARRRIFHLWFHPTNLADDADRMFDGLRQIFEHADALRSRGRLRVAPMDGIVARQQLGRGADLSEHPAPAAPSMGATVTTQTEDQCRCS
ncbi:MAG: hypothetical protein HYX76_05340 [Acidobacteria bacterium]|nr:hypothetical protein [Acidobacteriota bacterium]